MNTLLLNRESFEMPADGWYQIAPVGEFPHGGAGVVQVVDRVACESMVAAFCTDAMKPNFAGLLIDFDHFSLDEKLKSEAAGWITALEARFLTADCRPQTVDAYNAEYTEKNAGLWGKIRWSDLGEACVKGGRYRFISPVWSRADCLDLGDGRVRPVRLLNAALTNDPNLKGMVPLSNRKTADCRPQTVDAYNAADGVEPVPPEQGKSTTTVVANASNAAGKRLKWVLGDGDRNCPSCSGLAGQVHSEADWDAAGIRPGAGLLYCQGHCHCRLVETVEAVSGNLAAAVVRAEVGNRQGARLQTADDRLQTADYRPQYRNLSQRHGDLVDFSASGRGRTGEKLNAEMGSGTARGLMMDTDADGVVGGATVEELANALRFEREKNKVLMDEVVGLEGELVNHRIAEYGDLIDAESRDFWRGQLLTNREQADKVLKAMAARTAAAAGRGAGVVAGAADGVAAGGVSAGCEVRPKPMHNRATAKPVQPGANGAAAVVDDGKAGQIRNRAHEICKAEGVPFSVAFRRAEREAQGASRD